MIKQNYPLFLFTVSVLVLLVAYLNQPVPAEQERPTGRKITTSKPEPPSPRAPNIPSNSPTLSHEDGIIWEISATAPLETKLDSCGVTLLDSEMPINQDTGYYFRKSPSTFVLFTPVHTKRSTTVKNHLVTVQCLVHDDLDARDPLIEKIVNGEMLSSIPDADSIPLDLFFKVEMTEEQALTVGLKRLGHPELRLLGSVQNKEQLAWKLLGLMLTDRPLAQVIDLSPEFNHLKTSRTGTMIDLTFNPQTNVQVKPKRRPPSDSSSSSSNAAIKSSPHRPPPQKRPSLPDYR